jgi:hypothetical protein
MDGVRGWFAVTQPRDDNGAYGVKMPKKDDRSRKSEEQVLTPGGIRPRSAVRHVNPCEVVEGAGAALNSDGRLAVFGIGSDSDLYNIWQTARMPGRRAAGTSSPENQVRLLRVNSGPEFAIGVSDAKPRTTDDRPRGKRRACATSATRIAPDARPRAHSGWDLRTKDGGRRQALPAGQRPDCRRDCRPADLAGTPGWRSHADAAARINR